MPRAPGTLRLAAVAIVSFVAPVVACGETRRPIGDECLRGEDCLSGVCSSRVCVSAPALASGAGEPPEDDKPRIPDKDASADAAKVDASNVDGGG